MSKEEIYFWPSAFCVENDQIWFVYGKICVLCCYDMKKEKIEIIGEIPGDDICREGLYRKIIYKEKKLYLIPAWAKKVFVYDILQRQFSVISIPEYKGLMFCNAFLYDDKIICIPYSYPSIISINTKTDTASVLVKLNEVKQIYKISYFNMADNLEKKIAMVSPQSNNIFLYDVEHRVFETENIENNVDGYTSLSFFKNFIAMKSPNNQYIDLYDLLNGELQRMELSLDQAAVVIRQISRESILLDDPKGAAIWIYANKTIKKIDFDMIKDRQPYYSYKVGIYDRNSGVYFNNCNATFYKDFNKTNSFKIKITDEIKTQLWKIKKRNIKEVENENFFYGLKQFIEDMV